MEDDGRLRKVGEGWGVGTHGTLGFWPLAKHLAVGETHFDHLQASTGQLQHTSKKGDSSVLVPERNLKQL